MKLSSTTFKHHLVDYLNRSMPVHLPDEFQKRFQSFLKDEGEYAENGLNLVKEPLVELAPDYKTAKESLQKLSNDGNLHPAVAKAFANYLLDRDDADPAGVFPYDHQAQSLLAVNEGKNLVVCTGTGSGKTECFLLPLVNAIYKEHAEKGSSYDKHVRALILYPMNALVNDQIRRLRKLLKYLPEVTFGRFTGETDHEIEDLQDEDTFRNEWKENFPAITDDNGKDESSLSNEYRFRSQWDDGGADILVTNFAMLERLLLLPDTKLFDKPWRFIVLDEAHSYTGSAGTEIAWLVRRLENRLPKGDRKLQYLATSATLSTGSDAEEKAKEFAARLFPAEKETFIVPPDKKNSFSRPSGILSPDRTFFRNDEIRKLYDETIRYEADKADIDSRSGDIEILRDLCDTKKISLRKLVQLAPYFKNHKEVRDDLDHRREAGEIEGTDAIAWMCKIVLTYSERQYDFRYVLHDGLDDAKSESDNGETGNRLRLFEEWKKNKNHTPASLHWETVAYLYQAIVSLVQPDLRLDEESECNDKDVQKIEIRVCDEKIAELNGEVERFKTEGKALADKKKDLDARWRDLIDPTGDAGAGYREHLYNALSRREETVLFFEAVAGRTGQLSTAEIAHRMWPGDEKPDTETLAALIELGALAVRKGALRPLIDVRFHQVMRDVADIGVYFKGGNPQNPVFVRSIEEFAPSGEKIYSLGICRRCGQPYLLGYAKQKMAEKAEAFRLFRNRTEEFTNLHAFVLEAHEPDPHDDFAEPEKKDKPPRWIDLSTGEINPEWSGSSSCHGILWLISPEKKSKGKGDEFIEKCRCCGNRATRDARYGIVTPYEAIGTQYKVHALEAFGAETAPDVNERKRKEAPAEGRKVLAFSDSRAAAAGLAYEFDSAIESGVCDDIVLDLLDAFNKEGRVLSPDQENEIKRLQDEIAEYEADIREISDETRKQKKRKRIQENEEEIKHIQADAENKLSTISALVVGSDGTNLYEEQAKLQHCERLLEFETEAGAEVTAAEKTFLAKYRILKALLGGSSRRGLIPDELVQISSRKIQNLTNDEEFRNLFHTPFDVMSDDDMKSLLQRIWGYLAGSRDIEFDVVNDDWKNSLHNDFFPYPRKAFTEQTVTTVDNRHAVYKIADKALKKFNPSEQQIADLLNRIWTLFTSNEMKLFVGRIIDGKQQFVSLFTGLCDDLVIKRLNKTKMPTLPFVIQEHTAQIKGRLGAIFQRGFTEGRVNILSCSTTFEMGVDVGSLNNVFLCNMPPSPANYRQRAGRAGRRPGASPFILTLCNSRSSHDRHYWDCPEELFCGRIEPPRLYLDRPQFAARHFRAEALHDFLAFIHERHADEEAVRKWHIVSYFIVGRKSTRQDGKNGFQRLGRTCCDWLGDWQEKRSAGVQSSIEKIHRYKEDFLDSIGGQYEAAADVIFQLTGGNGFGERRGQPGFEFYRDLCGCHLPTLRNGQLEEHASFRRKALKEQLLAKIWLFRDNQNDDVIAFPADLDDDNTLFPDADVSVPQAILLEKQSINVLSEVCILPRYGFPVDTIELKTPDSNIHNKSGKVVLSRPVQQGMFEYAPHQSVPANKLRYESKAAKTFRYPGTLQDADGVALKFCASCEKAFAVADHCPCCGGHLTPKTFSTPEVFLSKKGTKRPPQTHEPRGKRIVIWSGSAEKWIQVPGMGFFVTEPSERFIQYINPGPGFKGFKDNQFYLHEVPTNIAIWKPATHVEVFVKQNGWDQLPEGFDNDFNRPINAYLSALYALRKAISRELDVQEADIGCLLHTNEAERFQNHWFVFYDSHTGGGSGCVLDLLLRGNDDNEGAERLRRIVEGAINDLKQCDCGKSEDFSKYPVPQEEWLVAANKDNLRRRASCQHCLRSYDNQFEHDRLDRFDALVVLNALCSNDPAIPAATTEDIAWQDFDPDVNQLIPGQPYLTREGTIVKYNPLTQNLKVENVSKMPKQEGN